ncbi:MAG: class II glutamine amidotransferase [Bacillota bacterium]
MTSVAKLQNPYGDGKLIESCGLFGMMDTTGRPLRGRDIIRAMANMRDRGNGLGGGFAAYGIYPEFREEYAFHLMYEHEEGRKRTEAFLRSHFKVVHHEAIPHRATAEVDGAPILRRYFLRVEKGVARAGQDDYVVKQVMAINTGIDGAYVFSSGKDMGVFKGVGYPEDIGRYFCLDDYEGYLWVGHSRFPTNTPGWWGGAHPFSILDWTVVHNGELSSYGTNRWFLEMYGYACTMQTDTEVLAYGVDLLARRHRLPVETLAAVFAPPLWEAIDRMSEPERRRHAAIRATFGGLLMNGPFSIIVAHHGEMIGLADRIRLRPLVAARRGDLVFLSSEESAIRLISPKLDATWIPSGGEPVVARLKPVAAEAVGGNT